MKRVKRNKTVGVVLDENLRLHEQVYIEIYMAKKVKKVERT